MDHHALGGAVDVGDLQIHGFLQPETTGVGRAQEGVVLRSLDAGKDAAHLLDTEYGGKSSFVLSSEEPRDVPISFEDVLKKEADPAVADAHRIGRPLVDVFAMEEILLELFLAHAIGSLCVEFTEHTDRTGVVPPRRDWVRSPLPLSCSALMVFSYQFVMTIRLLSLG